MAGESDALRRLIDEKFDLVKKNADYYKILGVPEDSDSATVKKAYFKLVKQIHPDIIRRLNDETLHQKSQQVFMVLNKAFQTLSDDAERVGYRSSLHKSTKSQSKAIDKTQEAKALYHKGKMFLDRRMYADARKALEQAVELDPKTGLYQLYLGFTWYYDPDISDDIRMTRCRKYFEKALELDPENPQASYAMALYYKSMGEYTMEYRALQDALRLDPDYLEAKRELRLLSMRWKQNKSSLASQWADFVSGLKRFFSGSKKGNASKSGKGKKKR